MKHRCGDDGEIHSDSLMGLALSTAVENSDQQQVPRWASPLVCKHAITSVSVFAVAVNEFADMSNEEFAKSYLSKDLEQDSEASLLDGGVESLLQEGSKRYGDHVTSSFCELVCILTACGCRCRRGYGLAQRSHACPIDGRQDAQACGLGYKSRRSLKAKRTAN